MCNLKADIWQETSTFRSLPMQWFIQRLLVFTPSVSPIKPPLKDNEQDTNDAPCTLVFSDRLNTRAVNQKRAQT